MMKRLTLAEFRERSSEYDAAVARTPGVSSFCSGSLWQLSAHDHLHRIPPGSRHLIVEDSGSWLAFVEREQAGVFYPFESAWMFGCPLIGAVDESIDLLARSAKESITGPAGFCLSGVPVGGELHTKLSRIKERARHYHEFPTTDCMMIDLSGGIDAWLDRRSKKFRRTLRQATEGTDVEIVAFDEETPEELFQRILGVQKRTYKWSEGTDIFQFPEYASFYRSLLEDLHRSRGLRLLFARSGGTDVAYIFGGVAGHTYRGLQMSYVEEVRSRGLGNRLQWETLRRCADDGITRYDLGMHATYKERWSDRREVNTGIFIVW